MPRFLAPRKLSNAEETTTQSQELGGDIGELVSPGSPPSPSKNPDSYAVNAKSTPPALPSRSRGNSSFGSTGVDVTSHRVLQDESRAEASSENKDVLLERPVVVGGDKLQQESPEDLAEEELSEEQLRKLFEDEEIERFLGHFNAHVHEVRLPSTNASTTEFATDPANLITVSDSLKGNIPSPSTENPPAAVVKLGSDIGESEGTEDSAWSMVDPSYLHSTSGGAIDESQPPALSPGPLTLSEKIARGYLLPILPPMQPSPDYRFTIGRARLQAERFNLVALPAYGPFCARMWGYASWKDRRTSLWYCATFWALWFLNLLLPALFAIILYTLFRRRIFSYPTLKELRNHRLEAARAEALGEEIEKKFATGPDFGVRDAWSLLRNVTKSKKKPSQGQRRKSGKLEEAGAKEDEKPAKAQQGEETLVKTDFQGESQAEMDIKRAILQAMTEISDLHERVKNIFLWRRPHTSKNYAMALALMFLVTLLLPAKYLAKSTYLVGGFLFWFAPPLILGLPPCDRARFPPPFADAPTDAEYAMEMIALRVARGERVVPAKTKSKKQRKASKCSADDIGSMSQDKGADKEGKDTDIDWGKWGERAARGFAWAEGGKSVFKGRMPSKKAPQANALAQTAPSTNVQPSAEMETSSYPAQYIHSPGLLTLTSTTLSFTQVFSSKPKVQIHLDHIRGVKKTGKMGGIALKWGENDENEREEKFGWIGGRDELFAKLVGWQGRHWIQI